ncbi:MAG: hypothetical protein K2O18_15615 [Oscillospiraceae bacterium]|nr:hypothetical protein [Oscillospiraceae bacterium]
MRTIRLGPPSLLRGLLLALFFLTGALIGHLYAGSCGRDAQAALDQYLMDYCVVYDAGNVAIPLLSCAAIYFGYAALLFLLGFSSAGVALIPVLSGVFGFFTMYTVSCFVRCYGRNGVLLAMGILLVRLLFTLPCFLVLAGEAWPLSIELFLLSFGRGKRSAPVLYGSRYFLLFILCAAVLTVGVCCERFLTPLLFRLAMNAVL